MSTCSSCTAPIEWAITVASGKRMPIDAEPTPDGNLVVVGTTADGTKKVRVLTKAERTSGASLLADEEPRYTSHFATCPNAERHRKR